jgi:hypothetical protein
MSLIFFTVAKFQENAQRCGGVSIRTMLRLAGGQESFPRPIQPVYDDKPIDIVGLMEKAGC